MARVFITGSSEGLGLHAGRRLAKQGHQVVLHARNADRADAARAALPACQAVVVGDVSSMAETRAVADQVNALGRCDAVIDNVAVGSEKNRGPRGAGRSRKGAVTQAWLAVGNDAEARESGRYLHHQKPAQMNPAAQREDVQERLLEYLRGITGVAIPPTSQLSRLQGIAKGANAEGYRDRRDRH